jgi:hypothetical protein
MILFVGDNSGILFVSRITQVLNNIWVSITGAWRVVTSAYVSVNGEWESVNETKISVNNEWK